MKISTGKTARAIRRREICSRLLDIFDYLINRESTAPDKTKVIAEGRSLILELTEITAIEANTPSKPRRRV